MDLRIRCIDKRGKNTNTKIGFFFDNTFECYRSVNTHYSYLPLGETNSTFFIFIPICVHKKSYMIEKINARGRFTRYAAGHLRFPSYGRYGTLIVIRTRNLLRKSVLFSVTK